MPPDNMNIGFVSTRIAGTDGVSLEVGKWADVLTDMGHTCYYFAGECDRATEVSYVVPEAHFLHDKVQQITRDLFDDFRRSSATTGHVHEVRKVLKEHLYEFKETFNLHALIAENVLSLPMNIPLGIALTELVAETETPVIGHHHDFTWERSRYAVHAASDYLQSAFPPDMQMVQHAVINTFAARQLAWRRGVASDLIPNVMDFENPDPSAGDRAGELRETLGIADDQFMVLQPTRIVPRKRIERSMELVRRLGCERCPLVITHAAGDEGREYEEYLRNYADMIGVQTIFASDLVDQERRQTEDGKQIYSLADAYRAADLVSYPSQVEGFGNAFLEAIFYRKPIVMSSYEIFQTDIQPKGFNVVTFDQFITPETVSEADRIMRDGVEATEMVEHNFELGKRYYSFGRLRHGLTALLDRVRSI